MDKKFLWFAPGGTDSFYPTGTMTMLYTFSCVKIKLNFVRRAFRCHADFFQQAGNRTIYVSSPAVLKVVIIDSMCVSSLFMMVRDANFPPIMAWEDSNALGSFKR